MTHPSIKEHINPGASHYTHSKFPRDFMHSDPISLQFLYLCTSLCQQILVYVTVNKIRAERKLKQLYSYYISTIHDHTGMISQPYTAARVRAALNKETDCSTKL